jgi:hypothetical protein
MKNIESIDNQLIDTETGEILGEDCPYDANSIDIDDLIGKLEYYKGIEAKAKAQRVHVEAQLAMIAQSIAGDGKTRRVAGAYRCAKVSFKTYDKWDQTKLESIRLRVGEQSFNQYFKVAEYKPKTKELQKLKNTAGEPEKLYHEFISAMRSEPGKPSVEIEK